VLAFVPGNRFKIYGVVAPDGSTIEQRLSGQMLHPNFPVPLQIMGATLEFYDISIGEVVTLGDVQVYNQLLNHPGEAVGYRVAWHNHAVAYITDTEHYPDRLDENVLALAQDADALIYDAMYTDEEYYSDKSSKVGWGHSTWQEAVKIAKAANVKRLFIFHHDPIHNDDWLDAIGEKVAIAFPGGTMAREGMVISVIDSPKKS
jgi:phosphoribosyl 1,2-cyclic phosphodiesterase